MSSIRNFCIIAHIDHGKSTLSDRLLEKTNTIAQDKMRNQVLDDMDLERERGITIKSHAVRMHYVHRGGSYTLNLIDTPGHVDFSDEVLRALAACEGAIIVVDAAQGIEAQTIANLELARQRNLAMIPVLNKVDLSSARVEEVSQEVVGVMGCRKEDIILASAKEGTGIDALLAAIVTRIPAPQGKKRGALQALVFDAIYDPFKGVKIYFRVLNGRLKAEDTIRFFMMRGHYAVKELGVLTPSATFVKVVDTGDVGYLTANIKEAAKVRIGDTITSVEAPCAEPAAGIEEAKPMVFAGLYPVRNHEHTLLRKALEKLKLNDAPLVWHAEFSAALGFGFRCGFLGMLHLEIVKERLEREAGIEVVVITPSARLRVLDKNGKEHVVHTPSDMPSPETIARIEEPMERVRIVTSVRYMGALITFCKKEKRGALEAQNYLSEDRVELIFTLPLIEVMFDFFDRIKSLASGYASMDMRSLGFAPGHLVKLDIMVHGEKVDALSCVVHEDNAYRMGKQMCMKAKELIPRHMFEVPIQALVGGKVIARETIKAFRKDVTAKLYGGDRSRKDKLLKKQKAGRKMLKQFGKVRIPNDVFLKILQRTN